ncbi:MAG: hypothetical protein ACKO96_29035 [Flammeovirgaceae bacterium]
MGAEIAVRLKILNPLLIANSSLTTFDVKIRNYDNTTASKWTNFAALNVNGGAFTTTSETNVI